MDPTLDFSALSILSNAHDKQAINKTFQETFRCRFSGLSDIRKLRWCSNLDIDENDISIIDELFAAMLSLIQHVLYYNITDGHKIIELFPTDFNPKFAKGIAKILISNMNQWRNAQKQTTISAVPKLVDFGMDCNCMSVVEYLCFYLFIEWRLDIKKSSNAVSIMSEPAVLVSMEVQPPQTEVGILESHNQIQFELRQNSLKVMIDGLQRIRDQLKKL